MLVRLLKGRKDFQTAQMLIKSCYFLPKRTWPKNLYEMALDGLIGHKWIGIGIFDAENNLIPYLDYKHVAPYKIEFGICCTDKSYRGHGYMTQLLQYVIDKNLNCDFTIGTYEGNDAMIHCIKSVGFEEDYLVDGDRIDGRNSIHYIRKRQVEQELFV